MICGLHGQPSLIGASIELSPRMRCTTSSLQRKVSMLVEMSRDHLEVGGRIVIADISFPTLRQMQAFAQKNSDVWEEEPYWLADQAQSALREAELSCRYQQVSPCGGVYRIEPA